MRDVQKRLLFEMMSNSRRSDRELARVMDTSQPTVTRVRRWLEENGFIMEYTLIPDFTKIGFEIVAFTFIKMLMAVSGNMRDQILRMVNDFLDRHPNVVTSLHGEGMGCDGILVSYHKNFSDFASFVRDLRAETIGVEVVGSFLASLEEREKVRPLTFKHLKEYIDENTGK
jgi:DNA-binding Lrp family transcriptional regulator